MRIGTLLAEPFDGGDPIGDLRRRIARAKTDGLASAWLPNILGIDALTALAVAGRDIDIEVGVGVVPTYPRHPGTLAQQALTAQAALDGRLTLGVGLSHKVIVEQMFGLSFDRPVQHMKDYLSVLLALLEHGTASFDGEAGPAQLAISTPRPHPVPVLIAALGPRMLELAGARTEGTVLAMTGLVTIRTHIAPTLRRAAEEAGRPAPRIVSETPVCVTDDVDSARERAAKIYAIYGHLPSYRAMLDREGAAGPADIAIIGDEDTVRAQIEVYAQAGVTDFAAGEFGKGTDAERTRALLRDMAAIPQLSGTHA
jgi:5,10-methylenetetrahydromethanopterin reductase